MPSELLVGGGFNPFEKNVSKIGSFPQGSGWKTPKNIQQKTPPSLVFHASYESSSMIHFFGKLLELILKNRNSSLRVESWKS